MARYVEGSDRQQVTLLPECLDDYIAEDNPVRVVEAYVSELDLEALGFEGMTPAATGRPAYHPSVLLKIYIYGYLNRIAWLRRLAFGVQLARAPIKRLGVLQLGVCLSAFVRDGPDSLVFDKPARLHAIDSREAHDFVEPAAARVLGVSFIRRQRHPIGECL